jgi:hypothetical protein
MYAQNKRIAADRGDSGNSVQSASPTIENVALGIPYPTHQLSEAELMSAAAPWDRLKPASPDIPCVQVEASLATGFPAVSPAIPSTYFGDPFSTLPTGADWQKVDTKVTDGPKND